MKFRLLTALWGAEFCELFLRLTARSLLAAGNFSDLSRRHDVTYTIYTTEADASRLSVDPVFRALSVSGNLDLQIFDEGEIDPTNPSSHWIIWQKGIVTAKDKGEFVVYIMPDVIYASGTLLEWAAAFEKGYRAVFTSIPEVVLETTRREIYECKPVKGEIELSLSVPEITKLFLKHVHPYHLCMLRDSKRWIVHPEFVGYVVPGFGFVQRIMGSHPFCFDPLFFDFNNAYIPLNHPDKIAFLPCTAISLEPFLKFMSLYYRSWKMTGDRLSSFAFWFSHYAADANDLESSHSYVFPLPGKGQPVAFARAHASGTFYRTQCLASRMIFRIWTKLRELNCGRAAEILALAHYAGRLRRYKLFTSPLTVLVPNDKALQQINISEIAGEIGKRRRALVHLVHDHCIPGRYSLKVGQRVVLTPEGKIEEKAKHVTSLVKSGGKILSGPFELSGFTIYVTDFVVPPLLTRLQSDRHLRAGKELPNVKGQIVESEQMLIHSSLAEQSNRSNAVVNVRDDAVESKNIVKCANIAETLVDLVKDYIAKELAIRPEMTVADVNSSWTENVRHRVTAAKSAFARGPHTRILYRALVVLRDRIRANNPWKISRILNRNARIAKVAVRELLFADRMEEAKVAAGDMVQIWRELAAEFVAKGRFELGLYCRRTALELNPGDMQRRKELVRELLIAGRREEAKAADGGNLELWRQLAHDLIAQGYVNLGLYSRYRVVELESNDLQFRKELVRELLIADQMAEANSAGAGLKQLWRELADELPIQGHTNLAQHCKRQVVETKPHEVSGVIKFFNSIQIEIGLLAMHDLLTRYSEAIGVPDELQSNDNPLGYLTQHLAASKASMDPVKDLTRLLGREPDFAEAWLEIAFCHWEAGEFVSAVEAALRATRARSRCIRSGQNLHPHGEAAQLIGRCLEEAGLSEHAISAYRKSLSFDEDQYFLHVRLGQLLWKNGFIDAATKEFSKGMTFNYQLANLPHLPRRFEDMSMCFE